MKTTALTPFQIELVKAMGQIFIWIRWVASEPAPGRIIAGRYVDIRKEDAANPYRIPRNVPDGQKIAFVLSDLAHNMADVASAQSNYFTADYFANECSKAAAMTFKSPCWEILSADLHKMARTFQESNGSPEEKRNV
jgi:hypothetical protein